MLISIVYYINRFCIDAVECYGFESLTGINFLHH